jgi:hypothetical protein
MRKLRRRRFVELFVVAGAMALVAAAPAGALAAGEETSGSTAGETGTESGGSTLPAPPPTSEEASSTATAPASTGWVPQEASTETSSHEAAPTRHGSSLGIGASSKQAKPKSKESSYSGGSSGYYESESSTPSTVEEPASEPRVVRPVAPVEPQPAEAAPDKGGHAAVGAAVSVALPESPQAVDPSSIPPPAALVASTRDRTASGSGGLPLPVLIVSLLILAYAGWRLLLGPVEPDLFRSGPLQRVRRALSRV